VTTGTGGRRARAMPVIPCACHNRHDTDRRHRGFPGNAKLASGILPFLGILLFLNYGVARLSDLLAFQMWPSDVDMAIFIVFGSAILYVVLMALPFMPASKSVLCSWRCRVGGIVLVYLAPCWRFR